MGDFNNMNYPFFSPDAASAMAYASMQPRQPEEGIVIPPKPVRLTEEYGRQWKAPQLDSQKLNSTSLFDGKGDNVSRRIYISF